MDENIARGKSQEAIKAACIFIACKEHNSARTFKEICNLTKVSKKELGRTYKQIRSLLTVDEGEISYESHVHRVSSQLDLPQDVVSSAVKVFKLNKLIKKVRTLGYLDGKSPITVVATCLYYCSLLTEEPMSAREIADASMCTEATLKNAYRILYEHRVDLRDEVATLKYTVGDLVY